MIVPVIDHLPSGFDTLCAEARAEGYRFVDRMVNEWKAGTTRFDRDGEALLAAYAEQTLAAIGGITIDPVVAGALRLRRFYVCSAFRSQGIGRQLVQALVAPHAGRIILVHAG